MCFGVVLFCVCVFFFAEFVRVFEWRFGVGKVSVLMSDFEFFFAGTFCVYCVVCDRVFLGV